MSKGDEREVAFAESQALDDVFHIVLTEATHVDLINSLLQLGSLRLRAATLLMELP